MSYILPQVKVFQEFKTIPTAVIENLNAFIFGPNYQLFRVNVPEEKPLTFLNNYSSDNDTLYAFPNQPAASTIDVDYVRLYFEQIWAQYAVVNSNIYVKSTTELNKLTSNSLVFLSNNNYSHSPIFKSRGVKRGDLVEYKIVSSTSQTYTGSAKVVDFEAEKIPSVISSASANAANVLSSNYMTSNAGTDIYTGSEDKSYFVEVLRSGVFANGRNISVVSSRVEDTITLVCTSAGDTNNLINAKFTAYSARQNNAVVGTNIEFNPYNAISITVVPGARQITIAEPGEENPFLFAALGTAVKINIYLNPDFTLAYNIVATKPNGDIISWPLTLQNFNSTTWKNDTDATFEAALNFNDWTGGDVDEIYTLICTTPGALSTAKFSLTSNLGDNATNLSFVNNTFRPVGTHGVYAKFVSGSQNFALGDTFHIVIRAARAKVKIYDSTGVEPVTYHLPAEDTFFNVGGFGVQAKFNAQSGSLAKQGPFAANGTRLSGLVAGDVFSISVISEKEDKYNTIVLSSFLPNAGVLSQSPQLVEIKFLLFKSGTEEIPSKDVVLDRDNWELITSPSDTKISVKSGISVYDNSWTDNFGVKLPLLVKYAKMFVQYRALLPTYSDTIHTITSISDVVPTLGVVHPDNPLAQGVYNALLNSGGRAVYYMAVPSNDALGYNEVLRAAELSDKVYGFVPLTRDPTIIQNVIAHINAMSNEESKHWRIAFVGSTLRRQKTVYAQATHPLGENYFAIISEVSGSDYKILTFVNSAGDPITDTTIVNAIRDIRPGDLVYYNFGANSFDTYVVRRVISENTIELDGNPPVSSFAKKVEIIHNNSVQEMANDLATTAASFADRRVYYIVPHEFIGKNGVVQSSEFAAAAVAGLTSAVPPQQGLTNIEIKGFSSVPATYNLFNKQQLNHIAANGGLIIMQNVADGVIYVRHQVSTKTADGNINTRELSIIKNLDSISYYFAARLKPYIGRYNITPELLEIMRTQLVDGLLFLGAFTNVNLIGPQILLTENTKIRSLEQHPILKDHVYIVIDLELPYPLNVIELHLVV